MWLKVIGIAVLWLSFSALGFSKALSLKRRQEQLSGIASGLESLARRISGVPQELSRMLPDCFSECPFLEIDGFKVVCRSGDMTSEDKRVADEFFGGLGHGFSQSEARRARLYMQIFEQRAKLAHEQYSQKARIWQTFGVSIGAAVAILLI